MKHWLLFFSYGEDFHMKMLVKIWNIFADVLLVIAFLLVFAFVGAKFIGYTPYVVTSGSMQSIYPVGSIIYVKDAEPQDVQVGDADCISAMEGRVGNVYYAFEQHGRWLQCDKMEAVPQPGYLLIYGVRGSTPYTHIVIVETVTPLGDGVYELTTVEGNINSSVRRYRYRYDATPKARYRNMSTVPESEQTDENCQYKLHNDTWYITGFAVTWGEAAYEPEA